MSEARPAPIPAPLWLHTATVLSGWIDYNGHMTDGYYAVAFGGATDAVLDYLGMGAAYRARTGCALYTVEIHINYERELKASAPLKFASLVLGVDARRMHLFHTLHQAQAGYVAATNEVMLLHVDGRPRACPMPADRLALASAVVEAHRAYELPPQVGAHITCLLKPDSNK